MNIHHLGGGRYTVTNGELSIVAGTRMSAGRIKAMWMELEALRAGAKKQRALERVDAVAHGLRAKVRSLEAQLNAEHFSRARAGDI